LPVLTVAQQRALLRMKSVRMSFARRRRCSPTSVLSDAALHEVALANSASVEQIRKAFAQHQIRDEPLALAFAEILQAELQNL
jgi:ribonuclease D